MADFHGDDSDPTGNMLDDFGWNVKANGIDWEPSIRLKIADFPDAVKVQDQEMDGRIIKRFAIYEHPDFERRGYEYTDELMMKWVAVHDGNIIGPYFNDLPPVKALKEVLLSL